MNVNKFIMYFQFFYCDYKDKPLKIYYIYLFYLHSPKWGLGIGDWVLGIGDWAQSPIPNPQSPIPNPHFILYEVIEKIICFLIFLY